MDGDGLLDLYVCNYVEIDPSKPITCKHEKGHYFACSPIVFPQTTHRLFRNKGNGKFEDVSHSSGIASAAPAAGLGVVIADLDGDGKPEIYVANDMGQAYLFRNLGSMRFREEGLYAGVALGPGGVRMAGMGIEVADLDGSGRPSLFVTNFQGLPNAFFQNRGGLRFNDASFRSGLGGPSIERLGFGVCAIDVDLDGNLDLAVANGHVNRFAKELFGVPYAQSAQLFVGDGAGKFRDRSTACGSSFVQPRVGRGLARADFDNDGHPDLALSSVGAGVALFRNLAISPHAWASVELIGDGKRSNRNAIGAALVAESAGRTQHHFVVGGGSYLSANDRRVLLGLGDANKVDRLTVRWPSGDTQEFHDLAARTHWRVREGNPTPERVQFPSAPRR
ncbi:MAG TPA: CRTAC1 family protein [Gemmataceae bacterium]|nr:CRTAC1 family protein [Gemmataceae bacterium]